MSAIKHPKQKKLASLKKDHRVYAWDGNKSFRGLWRKKKARMAKKARADSRQVLRSAQSGGEDTVSRENKQRRQLRKTGVVSLEQHFRIKTHNPSLRFSTFKYSSAKFTH